MKKFVLALLVGTIALTPVLASAQTGSGGTKPGTSSPSGTTGGSTSSDPATKTPGSAPSTGTMGAPSASPSGLDMSTFKTQPDCEKAGGMWQASSSSCTKK
jgi:hypothetical protein